ncbi:MAG: glycoside hydrolase TIM-barrel-like domain-containing protein [Parcubacteria group bacterium]|nr:glycoside hydrolase TIM-barrel-like domain-containing protein [Parcubacteria group bacterium]
MRNSLLFCLVLLMIARPSAAYASLASWQKGFTLRLQQQSQEDVARSLQSLAGIGANYVIISPGWYIGSPTATEIERKPSTPSDDLLAFALETARSLGLHTMLKPHVDVQSGQWRAKIDPADPAHFFTHYRDMMLHYSDMAQAHGVDLFSIGAELSGLTRNRAYEPYWRSLIIDIRARYHGKLTYSANYGDTAYDELFAIPFWNDLDFIGISAYHELADNTSPDIEELTASWADLEARFIAPAVRRIGKPLIITEVGYRSVDGAAMHPENFNPGGVTDFKEQADLYRAFFEFWKDKPYFAGVHFWDWWPGLRVGGPDDTGYTPQGKIAETVIQQYFAGVGPERAVPAGDADSQPLLLPRTPEIKAASQFVQAFEQIFAREVRPAFPPVIYPAVGGALVAFPRELSYYHGSREASSGSRTDEEFLIWNIPGVLTALITLAHADEHQTRTNPVGVIPRRNEHDTIVRRRRVQGTGKRS